MLDCQTTPSYYAQLYHHTATSGALARQGLRVVSRLGLAIWDTQRIWALGLAPPLGNAPIPVSQLERLSDIDWHSASGKQITAWRSVFLQELNRLGSAAFGSAVVPEECDRYVDAWNMKEVSGHWYTLMARLSASNPQEDENRYSHPRESEDSRSIHREILQNMADDMLMTLGAHHRQSKETANAGGQQDGGTNV